MENGTVLSPHEKLTATAALRIAEERLTEDSLENPDLAEILSESIEAFRVLLERLEAE